MRPSFVTSMLPPAAGLASLVLQGCMVPKPTVTGSLDAPAEARRLKPFLEWRGLSPADKVTVQAIIDATNEVINSPEFAQNLVAAGADLGELWLSPFGETLSAKEVAIAYLGIDPSHRSAPPAVRLGDETGGLAAETTIAPPVIELGQNTLRRWRTAAEIPRSCAVNTMAHEMAHTVPRSPGRFLFVDGHRSWATSHGRPLVSYTVGAVAQCTYLKKKPGEDLKTCIEAWGTNITLSAGCDPP